MRKAECKELVELMGRWYVRIEIAETREPRNVPKERAILMCIIELEQLLERYCELEKL